MKLFDIDFESFRLESFETEKSQIFEELKQLAQLYYLGIEKRRYELYEKSLELVTKKEYASYASLRKGPDLNSFCRRETSNRFCVCRCMMLQKALPPDPLQLL